MRSGRISPIGLLIVSFLLIVLLTPFVSAKSYEIAAYDIDLQLTSDGNYLITERITYDFLEGTFTNAEREVLRRGFDDLRFISLEGVEYPVESMTVSDRRDLKLRWTYPEATGRATFVIVYEAIGGLLSKDGRNVIDWNPIGSGWTVPIKNVNVTINLPLDPGDIEALPNEDLTAPPNRGHIQFHRAQIPPRTYYHVVVTFPEIIEIVREPSPPIAPWLLVGVVAGIGLMIFEIRSRLRNNPTAAASGPDPQTFNLIDMATLSFSTNYERRRGIVAAIFALAQAGKIKLIVKPKAKVFGTDEIKVEVLSDQEVTENERMLLNALRRKKTLQKFATESSVFDKITRSAVKGLQDRGLFSAEMRHSQIATILTALIPLVLSVIAFVIYGVTSTTPAWLGLGTLLILHSIGRMIGAGVVEIRSAQGLFVKRKIDEMLDEKMKRIDDLMRYEVREAWDELFQSLPYLVLHKDFKASKIERLKRQFRRLDQVNPPEWIGYDTANIGKAINALSVADNVNYVFLAVVATASSTGASSVSGGTGAAGVGAAGVGAGGGGGGAG